MYQTYPNEMGEDCQALERPKFGNNLKNFEMEIESDVIPNCWVAMKFKKIKEWKKSDNSIFQNFIILEGTKKFNNFILFF